MNEEAMTPDKEQVVEPRRLFMLAPIDDDGYCTGCNHKPKRETGRCLCVGGPATRYLPDAARTASVPPASQDTLSADLRRIAEDASHTHNWNTANPDHFDLHCGPCIAARALAGTHERPANHRPLADAARTASVTGLDPYRDLNEHRRQEAAGTHLFDEACYFCRADRALAPSIEQGPGETRPPQWWRDRGEDPPVSPEEARSRLARLREREPGETLRAALATALVSAMNTDDAQQFVVAFGDPSDQTGTWDLALDMADAILADLTLRAHRDFQQARSLGAAPVPEVEGDPFQMGDSAPSIEQEPGETLRAAHANWHDAACSGDCEIMRFVRAALEADRNPQETER